MKAKTALDLSESSAEDSAFGYICETVSEVAGIQLGERQRAMVKSRLSRRMSEVGVSGIQGYLQYLEAHKKTEVQELVSLLTTHHTYFFREYSQFEFVEKTALRQLAAAARARPDKKIKVWSAACSRGHEVYTLAMHLDYHLKSVAPDVGYAILGTDVDPRSVAIGKNGVYSREEVKKVPQVYLQNHWAKGTGEVANYVKVKSSLKDHCQFDSANLLRLSEFKGGGPFDMIFCRNVFIYFNADQIQEITRGLLRQLSPQGYLFIGISESLNGLGLPVENHGVSIYAHAKAFESKASPALKPSSNVIPLDQRRGLPSPASSPAARVQSQASPLIRVFCIDDSPTIHSLMKQILRKEDGFEIVGKAVNGLDAAEQLKSLKADVVTLDIHMPEEDGLTYLRKNFGPGHAPVVMVSSVSREDANLAMEALNLGASDYIEKPALGNLEERSDELRIKLKCAVAAKNTVRTAASQLDRSFQEEIRMDMPETKARIVVAGLGDKKRLVDLIRELKGPQPGCYIMLEGAGNVMSELARDLSKQTAREVNFIEKISEAIQPGAYSVVDFKSTHEAIGRLLGDRQKSILVYGKPSGKIRKFLLGWKNCQILIEDSATPRGADPSERDLEDRAADVVPVTSFAYLSSKFLGTRR